MKHSYRLLWVLAGGILLASCASAPKPMASAPTPTPTPTATTPAPAATPQVPAPDTELQQATELKAQIDKYGLGSQLPDAYQQGVDALAAGKSAMGTDNATAKTKLDEAIASFKKVEETGFPKIVQAREAEVSTSRDKALAAKADVASAAVFGQAESSSRQAQAKKSSGDFASAYDLYGQALDQYQRSTDQANQKRIAAEQALKQANDQLDMTKSEVGAIQKDLQANPGPTATTPASGGQ